MKVTNRSTVAQWIALLPHRKKVLGSNTDRPGPFCVEFACSPCVCVGFLWVLRFLPTIKTCILGLQLKISRLANTGVFTEMLINVHCPNQINLQYQSEEVQFLLGFRPQYVKIQFQSGMRKSTFASRVYLLQTRRQEDTH